MRIARVQLQLEEPKWFL